MKATHALANSLTHDAGATSIEAFAVAHATLLLAQVVANLEGVAIDWLATSGDPAAGLQTEVDATRARRVAVVSLLRDELGRIPEQMMKRQERSYPPFDRLTNAAWRTSVEELRAVATPDLFRKVMAAYDLLDVEIDLEARWLAARAAGGGVEAHQSRFLANELKRYDRDLWRLAFEACQALDAALSSDASMRRDSRRADRPARHRRHCRRCLVGTARAPDDPTRASSGRGFRTERHQPVAVLRAVRTVGGGRAEIVPNRNPAGTRAHARERAIAYTSNGRSDTNAGRNGAGRSIPA